MKNDIHPQYHPVVFKDLSNGQLIVTRSTMTSDQKIRLSDGNEYPVITLEITNMSHPFFTGEQRHPGPRRQVPQALQPLTARAARTEAPVVDGGLVRFWVTDV